MSQNTRNIFNCQSNDKARYCILVPFPGVAECNGIELYHLQWHPLNLIRLEDDLRDPTLGTALGSQRHWASDHQTNLSLLWRCSFFSCSSLVLQLRQKRTSRQIDLRNLPPSPRNAPTKKSGPSDITTLLVGFLKLHCSDTAWATRPVQLFYLVKPDTYKTQVCKNYNHATHHSLQDQYIPHFGSVRNQWWT